MLTPHSTRKNHSFSALRLFVNFGSINHEIDLDDFGGCKSKFVIVYMMSLCTPTEFDQNSFQTFNVYRQKDMQTTPKTQTLWKHYCAEETFLSMKLYKKLNKTGLKEKTEKLSLENEIFIYEIFN